MPDQEPIQWVCTICGYVHEGDEPPEICPVCGASTDEFEKQEAATSSTLTFAEGDKRTAAGEYLSEWARQDDSFEKKYARVVALAKTGVSEVSPMRTQSRFPDWDTILFKGAQLYRMPLN